MSEGEYVDSLIVDSSNPEVTQEQSGRIQRVRNSQRTRGFRRLELIRCT